MPVKGQRSRQNALDRKVESIFFRAKEIAAAVKDTRLDQDKGHNGNQGISDPTGAKAVTNITELPCVVLSDGTVINKPERWLKVVRGTYNKLDALQQEVFTIRYVKQLSWKCASVPRDSFYKTLHEILLIGKMAACQLGVMHVI